MSAPAAIVMERVPALPKQPGTWPHLLRRRDMTEFIPDHRALAWAAGFFDGEGSTCLVRDKRRVTYHSLRMVIVQTDIRPLQRFRSAVADLGTVTPQPVSKGIHKPQWTWYAQKYETTQAVIAMLWPYLCQPKREQATRCL